MHNCHHTSLCRTNTTPHNTTPLHTKHNMCTQNGNLTLQNNTHLRQNLVLTQSVSLPLPHKTKLFATIPPLYHTPHCLSQNNATILLQNAATPYFSLQSLYTEKQNCTRHCPTMLCHYKIQWNKLNFALTLPYPTRLNQRQNIKPNINNARANRCHIKKPSTMPDTVSSYNYSTLQT